MSHDPRYLEGLRLYREGRYWDSHEEWEEIWREAKGPTRHFFQGLIQLDAALIHTGLGHWRGVANLLRRALGHLERCPDQFLGLDVAALRERLREYRDEVLALRDGEKREFDWGLRPALKVEGETSTGRDGSSD
jgi:predicted metal-dependent hydrolase